MVAFCISSFIVNSVLMLGVYFMTLIFLEYPKCSTCQKAKKWLIQNNVDFIDRHIVENPPSYAEMKEWIALSKLSINKFFNTSGLLYRSLMLKDKLQQISEDEKIKLLCSNGMLIKRPLLIKGDLILIGFNENNWNSALLK